jgi:diguanylate cyclase (GGDEF)-like protein
MRKYTLELFKGKFDLEYCNNRLRIGRVHKRLGVTPKLYMSAIATLQEILDKVIEKSFNEADATLTKDSFHKIILFDSQLVFEAYIDGFFIEMETAHEEVEKYATSLGVRLDTLTRHMHDISTRDALTGLHNRRSFFDHFSRECRVARRHKLPLTLMFMDLNNFKPINDAHGHDAGDLVLRQVGTSMMNITRNVDFPARYGGDEFCLILPRTTLEDTDIPISRLLEDFTERCEYPVTFSIGLVQTGPDEIMEPEDLITLADKKMYVAKARSKKDGAHHIEK